MPWQNQFWKKTRQTLSQKVASIQDFDRIVTTLQSGVILRGSVQKLFDIYYSDQRYEEFRVPKDKLIDSIIPYIQELARNSSKIFRDITLPTMDQGANINVYLTRPQAASIVALMFFGLFDYDYLGAGKEALARYSIPSLAPIFISGSVFGLQCILQYFAASLAEAKSDDTEVRNFYEGSVIVYSRAHIDSEPNYATSQKKIAQVVIRAPPDYICTSDTKSFFVSSYSSICFDAKLFSSRESITMLVYPEVFPVLLLSANMLANESIRVCGANRISKYTGQGGAATFMGAYAGPVLYGYSKDQSEAMAHTCISFADASKKSGNAHYTDEFHRDITKAYAALSLGKCMGPISCEYWAQDSGNMQLRFIELLIAASEAEAELIYYAQDAEFAEKAASFLQCLQKNGNLVSILVLAYIDFLSEHQGHRLSDFDIFESITDAIT